jgi:hypothetical protein
MSDNMVLRIEERKVDEEVRASSGKSVLRSLCDLSQTLERVGGG